MLVRFRAVAVAGAAAVAASLLATVPADAASYRGKDPYKSGCGSYGYAVRTEAMKYRGVKVGTIKLMWSPKCKTNWTEIKVHPSKSGTIWVDAAKQKAVTFHYKAGNGGRHWGNMIPANNICAWGSATAVGRNSGDVSSGKTGKACD
ncbi:MAG: DUF2690 domain-containing protein [Nonomuraea sp.]|nr:DUF2690 domain-containing protein [Nonomuraea sp.]